MTELEQKVLDAAREWLIDRWPSGPAEKALAAAVARAWPGDLNTRERCPCRQRRTCSECLSAREMEIMIKRWERESTVLAALGE